MAKKKGTFEKLIEAIQDNFIKIIAAAIVLGVLGYFGLRNTNDNTTNPPPRPNTQQEAVKPGEGRG